MTKQTKGKKLTVTDLLKDKEKYGVKNDVNEEVYFDRLDANVVMKKPDTALLTEAYSMASDGEIDVDVYLIYNSIVEPNLKDSELIKAFNCAEPMDIVHKLFEFGEVKQLSRIVSELVGYANGVKVVDKVKN